MTSNWEVKSLGEIINLKRGYDLPSSKRIEGNKPIMASSGITGYHNEAKVQGPGVITGRSGQLGKVFYIEEDYWALNTTLYVEDFKGNDPKYIYYLLQTLNFEQFNAGSSVPTLNRNHVHQLEVKIPPINTQKKIGKFLYQFEEKMSINNVLIKKLEQITQLLFKRWFIDFEFPNEQGLPYCSSGGEMVESELGEIPVNFTVSNFESLILDTIGGDWGKDSIQGNYTCDVSILRGADIPEVKVGKSGKVPKRYILEKNYVNKKLVNNDIVIEISGGSPTQSTGRVTYINQEILDRYQDKLLCTNFCRIMRPKIPQAGLFIYMYFNYLYNEGLFFSYENGTTGIKNFDINSFIEVHPIAMPNTKLIIDFNEVVGRYYSYIQELGNENMKLEELRDSLLPKLLSGEIEIPDESVVDLS